MHDNIYDIYDDYDDIDDINIVITEERYTDHYSWGYITGIITNFDSKVAFITYELYDNNGALICILGDEDDTWWITTDSILMCQREYLMPIYPDEEKFYFEYDLKLGAPTNEEDVLKGGYYYA